MKQASKQESHIKTEDVLYDPRYMWVVTDDQKGGAPVMVFRTAEEAAETLLGTEDFLLQPVAVFERFKAGFDEYAVQTKENEHIWLAISKEPENALILFQTIKEAAEFVLDDPRYLLKPMKVF